MSAHLNIGDYSLSFSSTKFRGGACYGYSISWENFATRDGGYPRIEINLGHFHFDVDNF